MSSIVVIGAGGLGRETLEVLKSNPCHEQNLLGFIDDNEKLHGKTINGYPVLGGCEWLEDQDVLVVCGIGNNYTRKRVIEKLAKDTQFVNALHQNTEIGDTVTFGEGNVVTSNCTLTCNIKIGNHVFINLHTTIGHDSILEDYVNLAPGVHISGNVTLKEGCYIYTGAVILPGVTIGRWAEIGAGSVVLKDIPDYAVAVGIPAIVKKYRMPIYD